MKNTMCVIAEWIKYGNCQGKYGNMADLLCLFNVDNTRYHKKCWLAYKGPRGQDVKYTPRTMQTAQAPLRFVVVW